MCIAGVCRQHIAHIRNHTHLFPQQSFFKYHIYHITYKCISQVSLVNALTRRITHHILCLSQRDNCLSRAIERDNCLSLSIVSLCLSATHCNTLSLSIADNCCRQLSLSVSLYRTLSIERDNCLSLSHSLYRRETERGDRESLTHK